MWKDVINAWLLSNLVQTEKQESANKPNHLFSSEGSGRIPTSLFFFARNDRGHDRARWIQKMGWKN